MTPTTMGEILVLLILLISNGCVLGLDCISCDDCATLGSSNVIKSCEDDDCAIWINSNKLTQRGCFGDVDGVNFDKCSDHECNNEKFPLGRLECLQCETCHDLEQSEVCRKYEESDECYTLMLGANVRRGCISDDNFSIDVCEEAGKEFCETCATDNCNNGNLEHQCVLCDSENDPTCLDNYEIYHSICAQSVTHQGCYRYESKEGFKLGCAVDKPNDKCSIDSTDCFTCFEDNCNEEEFLLCYKCDNCDEVHSTTTTCTTYHDRCFVGFNEPGELKRACAEHNDYEQEYRNYYECKESFCNVGTFKLQCYQCTDCDDLDSESEFYCKKPSLNESCYVVVSDDETSYRGCYSDEDEGKNKCEEYGEFCVKCQNAGCNDDPALEDNNLLCVKCIGDDCNQEEALACKPKMILGRKDKCYTYKKNEDIQKGCLSDDGIPVGIYEECLTEGENCITCPADNCNAMDVTDLSCIVCNSSVNPKCSNAITSLETSEKCQKEEKSCISFIDENGFTIRGCAADLTKTCETNDPKCKTCETSNCNGGIIPADRLQCHQCSESEANCVSIQNSVYLESCQIYDENEFCVTVFSNADAVYRGCKTDSRNEATKCDELPQFCKFCYNSGCNNQNKMEENKLHCIECSGKNCDKKQLISASKRCLQPMILGRLDQCYTSYDRAENSVKRGCESNQICAENDNECETCGYDNCNNELRLMMPALSCIKCGMTNTVIDECSWGWNISLAQKCINETKYGTIETCFSCDDAEGNVVRGCTLDGDDECVEGIAKCDTDGCNNANVKKQKCIECEYELGNDCHLKAESFEPTECRGIIDYDNRGCYIMKNAMSVPIQRGCIVDLTVIQKQRCINAKDSTCNVCAEDGCNGSSRLFHSLFVIMLVFVMMLKICHFNLL